VDQAGRPWSGWFSPGGARGKAFYIYQDKRKKKFRDALTGRIRVVCLRPVLFSELAGMDPPAQGLRVLVPQRVKVGG